MPTLRLMLLLGLICLSFACGSQPNSGAANLTNNQVTNTYVNSSNSPLINSNSNSTSNVINNTPVDAELLKKIEQQQLEDKRKAEEKLKGGANRANSNTPPKSTAPKGQPQSF